jgi:hypothetical protein
MSTPPSLGRKFGRRRFLAGATGLGISLVWRSIGSWPIPGLGAASAPDRLAGLFEHRASARAIGREYLRVAPAEAGRGTLVSLVAESLPGGAATLTSAGDDELREALRKCTVRDFELQRTVELKGWVLSRTEARLCALTAAVDRA